MPILKDLWKKRKGQHILEYLDNLSNGFISAVKPEEVKYSSIKKEFKGKDFHLIYQEKGNDVDINLITNYKAPIGEISIGVGTAFGLPSKKLFEASFLKKDLLDNFLTESNDFNKGLLEEMIKDKVKDKDSVSLILFMSKTQVECLFEIKSNKGVFSQRSIFDNSLGKESFRVSSARQIEVGDTKVTLLGKLALELDYEKISEEDAKDIVQDQLEKDLIKHGLNYLPPSLKIKEATLENELTNFMADDGTGKLILGRGFELKSIFYYEIQGDYKERLDDIKAYGCDVSFSEGVTKLYGNPLLITRLGQELAGKQDYGLLKEREVPLISNKKEGLSTTD